MKKLNILGLFFSIIFLTNFVNAQFSLEEIDMNQYVKNYNSLPAVEESSDKLSTRTLFNTFLQQADQIVENYGLRPYIGLRLNHKHFELQNGHIMGENYEVMKENPYLVTQSYSFEDALSKGMVPASWFLQLQDGKVKVNAFEFSNDDFVKEGIKQVQQNPKFIEEMFAALKEYNLENIFSLAILGRSSLPLMEDQTYLERSAIFSNIEKSIIAIIPKTEMPKDSINTAWYFNDSRKHGCNPTTSCERQYDGSHKSVYGHSYYNED